MWNHDQVLMEIGIFPLKQISNSKISKRHEETEPFNILKISNSERNALY